MAAQPANTFDVYDSKGNKQSWINAIYDISPDDTPLFSAIGKGEADNIRHQWQTDKLRAAVTTNAAVEGGDYDYIDRTPTVEVQNITQISIDPFLISGTNEAVRKWGRGSEIAYQKARSMKVIKMDIEATIFANIASDAGTSAVARKCGTLATWLTTNVDLGATGTALGYNSATGLTRLSVAGTPRALAETQVKSMMEKCFTSGATPRTLYMPAVQKKAFSALPGIANIRHNQSPGKGMTTITASADLYVSDFGTLAATPARQCLAGYMYAVDHDMLGVAYLRPFETERLAKTGDSEKFNVIAEWTLVVKNEAAHGMITALS